MKRRFMLPVKGVNKALSPEDQPPLTTQHMMNVRAPGTLERQLRLSQRPGLDKWSDTLVGALNSAILKMCRFTVLS